MCEQWMRPLELKISFDEYLRLPQNNAYKYEYLDGRAFLSPRAKYHHALLDLDAFAAAPLPETADKYPVRPLASADWERFVPLFGAAFDRQLPFGVLHDEERKTAVRQALERTRTGGDGPLVDAACCVVLDVGQDLPLGAMLITLLPDSDPSEWGGFQWNEPPPPDSIERRLGRPHLTWVFVHPWQMGRGAGTALLHYAVGRLRNLGFHELASTFMSTNDSSITWHWRNGFRLVEHPSSARRLERRFLRRE